MKTSDELLESIRSRLETIYPGRDEEAWSLLKPVLDRHAASADDLSPRPWSPADIALITYGGQVREPEKPPLQTLCEFLLEHDYQHLLNTVHILPFSPFSSDDGFSVIDYRQVDPELGDWSDVARLGEHFSLMFDLVLNHISSQSEWFQEFLKAEAPGKDYFVTVDPSIDLSQVTRPRSLPLLTEYDTASGKQHVWTTFSPDQVDLNYGNPQLLAEMIDILLEYADRGAEIIRLDAIAFLWKEIGTTCVHLPNTHEVVKLMRDAIELTAPNVWVLTETNVPHVDNVSYFGAGDEAHMVYQFSLPPLLLDALLFGDVGSLTAWLKALEPAPAGCTFFNFTASHDGVGVRPLEGLVPPERVDRLAEAVKARGGRVGTRRKPDGTDAPYELNVTYVDALGDPAGLEPELHARRFLASQAIMLSLQGIPGIYFHSLVGGQNDIAGMEASGHNRRINRKMPQRSELNASLAEAGSLQQLIFSGYQNLLRVRREQAAFDPEGPQRVLESGDAAVLAFQRSAPDDSQTIVVLLNVASEAKQVDLGSQVSAESATDLITGESHTANREFTLQPYQCMWLQLN